MSALWGTYKRYVRLTLAYDLEIAITIRGGEVHNMHKILTVSGHVIDFRTHLGDLPGSSLLNHNKCDYAFASAIITFGDGKHIAKSLLL
jgi:hypothetical protein